MSALKGCFTVPEVAELYGVPISTVRLAVDRLGIGHRFGRSRVVYAEDFPQLETAFRTLGYKLPSFKRTQPQPVAASATGCATRALLELTGKLWGDLQAGLRPQAISVRATVAPKCASRSISIKSPMRSMVTSAGGYRDSTFGVPG